MVVTFRLLKSLNVEAIALFPVIIFQGKALRNQNALLNHERIHLKQQLELLVIPFYIWYIIEYLFLRRNRNHKDAYRNIVFEKEAYSKENDLHFLETRSFWNFLNYYRC
ncbi:hypothetical protein [Nonlabens marinus]|uniref:DUF4157 domain-containing protein n=1 Tax=Nonlabens marinus S1-08 TaxID=1454201 RepID=W8VXC0_9FLAO|nr:hypothetical protein [Nonlabens marinus]BAO55662.1 hypothetical protein NMS_1653 [Nonlabens marinus S1-08]